METQPVESCVSRAIAPIESPDLAPPTLHALRGMGLSHVQRLEGWSAATLRIYGVTWQQTIAVLWAVKRAGLLTSEQVETVLFSQHRIPSFCPTNRPSPETL